MAVRKLKTGRRTIEFESRGHRVFRRVPSGATKAQADEYELQLRRQIIDQAVLGKNPTVDLAPAIEAWLEEVVEGRKSAKSTASKAGLVLGEVDGLSLTKGGIVEAAERVLGMERQRGEGELTAATLNRRLAVLKGTAKWAWKIKHWTPENLSPYVVMLDKKLERVRRRAIDQRTAQKLLKKAPDFETKAYMALGLYGLMRTGEIMRTQPADIGRGLTLPETKGGVPRVVPIISQLRPYLKAIPFKRHPRTLYAGFEAARDAAGIVDLVHHDLRRSGATILLNEGVSLEIVAHILGDSLEVARKHYAHVLNRTAEKAMRRGFKPIKSPSGKRRASASA